jgi:hypothetical protein
MLTIYKAMKSMSGKSVHFEEEADANKYIYGTEVAPFVDISQSTHRMFGLGVLKIEVYQKGEFVQEAVDWMKALQKLTPHERQLLGL